MYGPQSDSVLYELFYSGQLNETELIILSSLLDGKAAAYISHLEMQPSLSPSFRQGLANFKTALGRDREADQREKEQLQRKKDELERAVREQHHRYIQIVISLAVTAILAGLSLWSWLQHHRERSFLLLTDEARAARDTFLQSKRNQVALGIGGMVVAVLTGILGSYLSAWLMQ